MSRLITYILGVFWITAVGAQPFTVTNYDIPEGMPSSEVYDIVEDRNGFLWFGTDNGVVRFDGQEMKILQVKDGLTDPVVFNFIEDDDGRLWFRTYSGKLCYLENGVIKPYEHNNLLAKVVGNGLIQFEHISKNKELWFTARNREGLIDSMGRLTVDTLDSEAQKKSLQVRIRDGKALVITATRWVSRLEQILINEKSFPVKIDSPAYISQVVADIYWRGKLYFSAYNDLFEYDNGKLRRPLISKDPIISLSTDRDGNFWVGYLKGGIARYSDTQFSDPWTLDFLKDKSVTKVHQDNSGGMWFSTIENGVYHVPNFTITHFKMPDLAKIKSVNSSNKHIIVGDKNGVVRFYDKKSATILHSKSFGYSVMAVFCDSRQNFWISGHAAIAVFDPSFRLKHVFENMNAGDFYETKDQSVWALGRLHLFQFDRDIKLAYEEIFYYNMFRNLVVRDSMILLGGRIGLHKMNIGTRRIQNLSEFENF
ncbi:MAG TPA: two-component regulator propeller domain-containing protein, partial [Chryseosolibacter sp.]|nr:two-component regulator propeller domain-containing protein [Chryseosolibacter sp.]